MAPRHELPWASLDHPLHAGMQRLVRDLNLLYRERVALHRLDCMAEGFEWIVGDDADQSVFVWALVGGASLKAKDFLAIIQAL